VSITDFVAHGQQKNDDFFLNIANVILILNNNDYQYHLQSDPVISSLL